MKPCCFLLALLALAPMAIANGTDEHAMMEHSTVPEQYTLGETVIRGGIRVTLNLEPEAMAGQPTDLVIALQDQSTGNAVTPHEGLVVEHEAVMHVLIVRNDLQFFGHVHPGERAAVNAEEAEKGVYRIPYTFQEDGTYWVWVQFVPSGTQQEATVPFQLQVKNRAGGAGFHELQADYSKTKIVDGYIVTMESPKSVKSNVTFVKLLGIQQDTSAEFTFHIQNPDGSPHNNLANLLGEKTHSSAISSDGSVFTHEHAEFDSVGPNVSVRHTFPKPGIYLLTAQFRPDNLKDITVTYFIKVEDDNYITLLGGLLFWTLFWIAFYYFVHAKALKQSTHHTWMLFYVLLWALFLLIHFGLWSAGWV